MHTWVIINNEVFILWWYDEKEAIVIPLDELDDKGNYDIEFCFTDIYSYKDIQYFPRNLFQAKTVVKYLHRKMGAHKKEV